MCTICKYDEWIVGFGIDVCVCLVQSIVDSPLCVWIQAGRRSLEHLHCRGCDIKIDPNCSTRFPTWDPDLTNAIATSASSYKPHVQYPVL